MEKTPFLWSLLVLGIAFSSEGIYAQSKIREGAILEKGTNSRISKALVRNKRLNHQILTDNLGLFSIIASPGDTLEISHPDYIKQELVVAGSADLIIYLQVSNLLREVAIKGESARERLAEVETSFRKKGIYYKGRPPLKLLSPFGGSPLTFFYELLSKDGKRARRFGEYAQSENDYYEVASRFNDYSIKRVTAIKDDELQAFKLAFWPSVEQIRTWNDFDLLNYIKTSFSKFKSKSSPIDSLKKDTD